MLIMDPVLQSQRRAKNLRTGWIVGGVAFAFFLGFLIRVFATQ